MKPFIFKLSISLVMLFQLAPAQQTKWAKHFETAALSRGSKVVTDPSGNILTTGTFSGTVDFDPGPGSFTLTSNRNTGYLVKLDTEGNLLWAQQLPGVAADMTVDSANHIVLLYNFANTSGIDPGPSYTLQSTNGSPCIMKLNPGGQLIWTRQFPCQGLMAYSSSKLLTDRQGHVYVLGLFFGTLDADPGPGVFNLYASSISLPSQGNYPAAKAYVAQLDSAGNLGYAIALEQSYVHSLVDAFIDTAGNLVTAERARYYGWNAPDPVSLFINKFSPEGTPLWWRQIKKGDNGFLNLRKMVGLRNNCFLLTGECSGDVDLDPGPGVYQLGADAPEGSTPSYILQLSENGYFNWANALLSRPGTGTVSVVACSSDAAGYVYLAGTQNKLVDFDPSGSISTIETDYTSAFLLKLNPQGAYSGVLGLSHGAPVTLSSMYFDRDKNLYFTGYFSSTADFNPSGVAMDLSCTGTSAAYLQKLSYDLVTGMDEQEPPAVFNLYPNPVSSELHVRFDRVPQQLSYQLFNAEGKQLPIASRSLGGEIVLDLSHCAPGLYLLQLDGDGWHAARRIIKD